MTGVVAVAVLGAFAWWNQGWGHQKFRDPVAIEQLKNMASLADATPELTELRGYAQEGAPLAQRALGEVLVTAKLSAQQAEGVAWLLEASKKGDGVAALDLGKAHFLGRGVARDYASARLWFVRADASGNEVAAYYLGLIYRNGYGVTADPARASQQFSRAAEKGLRDAMFMLANSLRDGESGTRNDAQSLAYYRQAGELEHPAALQTLAMIYLNGEMGEARDEAKARHYLAEAEHALRHYVSP